MRTDWHPQAACRGKDLEQFFPDRTMQEKEGFAYPNQRELEQLCESCPVQAECLDHALRWERYGWWAGTTANEREKIRKKTGIKCLEPSFVSGR